MSPRTDLAGELSRRWYELGSMLRSRRLLALVHADETAKLTPTKLRALDVIARGSALRIGELAEVVGIDETTATRLVDRLEEAGLAVRGAVEGDRRAIAVSLTLSGERIAQAASEERTRFFADVLAALEADERAELVRLTAKASDALRATREELAVR